MKATKLSDEVWYFQDAIDSPSDLLNSIEEWGPVPNQDFMKTAITSTKSYLETTDDAILKCLDIWFNNHLALDPASYKLMKNTYYYKRGPGAGYGPHSDFATMPDGTYEQVSATILGYLCDGDKFDGGEIFFPDYDISIKPEIGSVVIFGHKVKHGVQDVTSGERAIVSTFLVKNHVFYKDMYAADPKNPTDEEVRRSNVDVPQYEIKNANVDFSKQKRELESSEIVIDHSKQAPASIIFAKYGVVPPQYTA